MTREEFALNLSLRWADLPHGELDRATLRAMRLSFGEVWEDALFVAPCMHDSQQNYLNTVTQTEHCGICQRPLRKVMLGNET